MKLSASEEISASEEKLRHAVSKPVVSLAQSVVVGPRVAIAIEGRWRASRDLERYGLCYFGQHQWGLEGIERASCSQKKVFKESVGWSVLCRTPSLWLGRVFDRENLAGLELWD